MLFPLIPAPLHLPPLLLGAVTEVREASTTTAALTSQEPGFWPSNTPAEHTDHQGQLLLVSAYQSDQS